MDDLSNILLRILSPGSPLHTVLVMDLLDILLRADSLTRFSFAYSSCNGSLGHPFAGRFSHQVLLCTQFLEWISWTSFCGQILSPGSPLHTVLGNVSLEYPFVCGFSHQVLLCKQLLVMDLLSKAFLHVDSLTRFAYACSYW